MSEQPDVFQKMRENRRKAQEVFGIIGNLGRSLQNLCILLAYPWIILLHYRFGERAVRLGAILICTGILFFAGAADESAFGMNLAYTVFVVAIIHSAAAHFRRPKSEADKVHSRDLGIPWVYRIPRVADLSVPIVLCLIEPLIVAAVSVVPFYLDAQWTGGIILASAPCLMIFQAINCQQARNEMLDRADSQIAGRHMETMDQSNQTAAPSPGYFVPGNSHTPADDCEHTDAPAVRTVGSVVEELMARHRQTDPTAIGESVEKN